MANVALVVAMALLVVVGVAAALALGAVAFAVASVVAIVAVAATCAGSAARVLRAAAPVTHLDIAPPAAESPDRDPAYRSYLFGPVAQDVRELVANAAHDTWTRTVSWTDDSGSLARRIVALWNDSDLAIGGRGETAPAFFLPSMVGGVLGTVAGSAVGAVLASAVLVVFVVLMVVAVAGALLGAAALRGLELGTLRLRGITLECGNCHRRVTAPAYDCDACPMSPPARHRHLVPGRLGVLARTCRCGHRLPTLLMAGKSKLRGYCQHPGCGHPLPADGMTTPTFHVPVVAGTSAGKTVLMAATVADLDAAARAAGSDGGVEFAEESRAAEVQRMLETLRDGGVDGVAKTLPEQPLRALNLYLGATGSRSRRLLYLYDAAGERYETSEGTDTLRFLGYTAGVLFVVDPFAIDAVGRTVAPADREKVRPSPITPTEAAERFTAHLRARLDVPAGRRIGVAAAVVVTKCDALLTSESIPHPYDGPAGNEAAERAVRSAAVREWLRDSGARTLVHHVENSYRRRGYFAVSALAAFGAHPRTSARTGAEVDDDDPAAPVRWLLTAREAP
jgi:hypothetical protein